MKKAVMKSLDEKYVTNEKGERVGVILSMEDYRNVLKELEELESIRAYDEAKASKDKAVPFEQAVKEIEKGAPMRTNVRPRSHAT